VRRRRPVRFLACAAVVLAVGACSPDTDTPVPEEASEPFACGKLPVRGVELMSGRDELDGQSSNDLGGGIPSQCIFKDGDEFVLHVNVDDWSETPAINPTGMTAPEEIQDRLEQSDERSPLAATDVGVDGEGWVSGTPGDSGALWWACDDVIMVRFSLETPVEGRDTVEDLTRYARSVLPAACDVTGL